MDQSDANIEDPWASDPPPPQDQSVDTPMHMGEEDDDPESSAEQNPPPETTPQAAQGSDTEQDEDNGGAPIRIPPVVPTLPPQYASPKLGASAGAGVPPSPMKGGATLPPSAPAPAAPAPGLEYIAPEPNAAILAAQKIPLPKVRSALKEVIKNICNNPRFEKERRSQEFLFRLMGFKVTASAAAADGTLADIGMDKDVKDNFEAELRAKPESDRPRELRDLSNVFIETRQMYVETPVHEHNDPNFVAYFKDWTSASSASLACQPDSPVTVDLCRMASAFPEAVNPFTDKRDKCQQMSKAQFVRANLDLAHMSFFTVFDQKETTEQKARTNGVWADFGKGGSANLQSRIDSRSRSNTPTPFQTAAFWYPSSKAEAGLQAFAMGADACEAMLYDTRFSWAPRVPEALDVSKLPDEMKSSLFIYDCILGFLCNRSVTEDPYVPDVLINRAPGSELIKEFVPAIWKQTEKNRNRVLDTILSQASVMEHTDTIAMVANAIKKTFGDAEFQSVYSVVWNTKEKKSAERRVRDNANRSKAQEATGEDGSPVRKRKVAPSTASSDTEDEPVSTKKPATSAARMPAASVIKSAAAAAAARNTSSRPAPAPSSRLIPPPAQLPKPSGTGSPAAPKSQPRPTPTTIESYAAEAAATRYANGGSPADFGGLVKQVEFIYAEMMKNPRINKLGVDTIGGAFDAFLRQLNSMPEDVKKKFTQDLEAFDAKQTESYNALCKQASHTAIVMLCLHRLRRGFLDER